MKKVVICIIAVLAVIGMVVAAVWTYAARQDFFFSNIETLVKEETGYTLDKPGPAKFSLFPQPALEFRDLVINNPASPDHNKIAQVEKLNFRLQWFSLFRERILLDLDVSSPKINLHIYPDGNNWITEELRTITAGLPFDLGTVDSNQTILRITDHRENDQFEFQVGRLQTDFSRGKGNIELGSSGNYRNMAFGVLGTLDYDRDSETLDITADFGLDQLQLSGTANEISDQTLSLTTETDKYPINGKVSGSLKFPQGTPPSGQLQVHIKADNTAPIVEWIPESIRPDIPYDPTLFDGIEVSGQLKLQDRDLGLENVNLNLDSQHLAITMNGQGKGLLGPDPNVSLQITLSANQPVLLEKYHPTLADLTIPSPVKIAGKLIVEKSLFSIKDLQAQIGKSDIAGLFEADLSAHPPRISADISSKEHFEAIVQYAPESGPDSTTVAENSEESGSDLVEEPTPEKMEEQFEAFVDSVPVETDWITEFEVNVSLDAKSAWLGGHEIKDFSTFFITKDGQLEMTQSGSIQDSGPIRLRGIIDTNLTPPKFSLKGELDDLDLEIFDDPEVNDIAGGRLNGNFELESSGESLSEILHNMQGGSLLTMGQININSAALQQVSSDILSSMLSGILNKEEGITSSNYQCGVLGLEISDGVILAKKTATLQATDYNLIGKGFIDLNTGAIDISVTPKARKGLGLSVSTIVGGFRVTGNLAALGFNLRGSGLFTTALLGSLLTPTVASGAVAEPTTAVIYATGVVVKGLYDRITASSYTCDKTLKRIERLRSKTLPPDQHHLERSLRVF